MGAEDPVIFKLLGTRRQLANMMSTSRIALRFTNLLLSCSQGLLEQRNATLASMGPPQPATSWAQALRPLADCEGDAQDTQP